MVKQSRSIHPTAKNLFEGRRIVVASMHGKHHAMKPLLKQYLGLDTVVVPDLNTDEFGTFSGEIERPFDPVTTLRKKILKALKESGETLGIGNEGSFGPHPALPIVQANQEVVMLIDLKNDLEITESVISTETNHAQRTITSMKDLTEFAEQIGFPSHGIVLKKLDGEKIIVMEKGIILWESLYAAYLRFKGTGKLVAETDMRGYMNPTRIRIIERATEMLMKKINNLCPACHWPGFGVVEVKPGLPCRDCGEPSRSLLSKIYRCDHCGFADERYYTKGLRADPAGCDRCNP